MCVRNKLRGAVYDDISWHVWEETNYGASDRNLQEQDRLLWLTKTWGGKKKQPKTQFCSSCTKMLAGGESIFYLPFIPCNMWKKERPISSACVIFCYFETTKEGARKEKREIATHSFLSQTWTVSPYKVSIISLCFLNAAGLLTAHLADLYLHTKKNKRRSR